MHFIYVLKHSETKERYIGKTNNLKRRISEHNNGLNKSTKRNSGTWIIAYSEIYRNKIDADNRELKLKAHGRAKQELFKRIINSLN